MANVHAQLRQAIGALKAGRRDEARDLLLFVVDQDERNEQAWLYLSGLVDSLEEQQICLENVLALNPQNEKAQKGLEIILREAARSAPPPPPVRTPPPSAARAVPPAAAGPAEAEANPFGQESFDEWMSSAASLYGSSPQPDPDALVTSVDWSRDDGPAVYGSGRQIAAPSPAEYDDWVQGLNLADTGARAAASPTSLGTGGWDSAKMPAAPSPWEAELAEDARFAEPAGAGRLEDADAASVLTASDQPQAGADPFAGQTPAVVAPVTAAPAPVELPDDSAVGEDWLTGVSDVQAEPALATPPAGPVMTRATDADYYRYIPAEIGAPAAPAGRRLALTLLAVLVLIGLNAASLYFLLA